MLMRPIGIHSTFESLLSFHSIFFFFPFLSFTLLGSLLLCAPDKSKEKRKPLDKYLNNIRYVYAYLNWNDERKKSGDNKNKKFVPRSIRFTLTSEILLLCVFFFPPFHVLFPNFSLGNSRIYNRKVFWRYTGTDSMASTRKEYTKEKVGCFFVFCFFFGFGFVL